MPSQIQTVYVVGASDNASRYSNMALKLLAQYGHNVVPINPHLKLIEGQTVWPDITQALALNSRPDTITLYVNAKLSDKLANQILAAKPNRVIFNPGSENPNLSKNLLNSDIESIEACTLVLLKTGQF